MYCHPERSEGSRTGTLPKHVARFFVALRMTLLWQILCHRYQRYCKTSNRTMALASASTLRVSSTKPTSAVRGWHAVCFTPLWWRSVLCARYLVHRDFCFATVISAMACWRLRCASTKAISWLIYGNLCSQEGKNSGILAIFSPNPQAKWKERSHERLGFSRK